MRRMHVLDQETIGARVNFLGLTHVEAANGVPKIFGWAPGGSHRTSVAAISQNASFQFQFLDDFLFGEFHGLALPFYSPDAE
jgi:hypothetical protein